jgi:cyclopropane fatty-acyl-phospholipid synthase-like methyltransferase
MKMIRQESACDTLVHLFAGKGLLLEVAREQGLHAVGIDLSRRQCRHAERFDLEKFRRSPASR